MNGKREFGDYQTPSNFTNAVCAFLRDKKFVRPVTVLEPTCGVGNFLKSSTLFGAEKYRGIEIDSAYCDDCRKKMEGFDAEIINSDFFSFDIGPFVSDGLLVIGNPPWVTSSTLSVLDSGNVPEKSNFKGLRGIDAMTGAGNFDISENIILRIIETCAGYDVTVAMLCKTTVARNVYAELQRNGIGFEYCDIAEFDAGKVFGISAGACLLLVRLGDRDISPSYCSVYSLENPDVTAYRLEFKDGNLRGSLTEDSDGECCFTWRQGVKHDCAKLMEFEMDPDGLNLRNGDKESIRLEPDLVYPLVKSSMFKEPVISSFKKYVLVTQKKTGEETSHLEKDLPLTWRYLTDNTDRFDKRKSSIYDGAPKFSMYGVGDYTYARYKVGVSGFYKKPLFSLLFSPDGKPVMTDDTSYFICLPTYDAAYIAMLYLNSEPVQNFLKGISFRDSKRPYTKKVLQRLDFTKICERVSYNELIETETHLGLERRLTNDMIKSFADAVRG